MYTKSKKMFPDWMLEVKGIDIALYYQEYLADVGEDLLPDEIVGCVSRVLAIPINIIQSKTRKRDVLYARYIAAHLIRATYPKLSLTTIGWHLGHHEHSTPHHALATANDLIKTNDREFMPKYNRVCEEMQKMAEKRAQLKKQFLQNAALQH